MSVIETSTLLHALYINLVVKCADFMTAFRDPATGLPRPSWNLWEDRRGIHTFTCASVVGGLRAAAHFARLFAENEKAVEYETAAAEIVEGMKEHLYSTELGRFLRGILAIGDESSIPDEIVDASLFSIFYFGCFDARDPMVKGTMEAVEEKLLNDTEFGGVARFESDGYMRVSEAVTGNSWFICTLWLAEYYIAKATSSDDLLRSSRSAEVDGRTLPCHQAYWRNR